MASLGTAFVEIRPDTKGFTSSLTGQVGGSLSRFQRSGAAAFTGISRAATGAGIAVGLVGAAAIHSSIQFESAFAGVRKTVDATDAQLKTLEAGILSMSTNIPATAEEISAVAEAAGQLGIQTDSILGFSKVMVDLGETTNLSSDQAATALARLANITQMPQDQFDRLGATIVDLGNKGASTEAEIVEMGTRIAAAGNQVGLAEHEILAFANALSSVGIEAEAGGTAISRVFIELQSAVMGGGAELQTFADVAGQSASDFQQSFETDAAGATVSFIEGLRRIQDEGGNVNAVLEELGLADIRVRNALLSAAGAGDLFRQSLEDGATAWRENTALTEEAAKRYETTAAQLEIMRNKFTAAGIGIGNGFLPAIKAANDALDPFLDGIVILGRKVGNAIEEMTGGEGFGALEDAGADFKAFVKDLEVSEIVDGFEKVGNAVDELLPLIKSVGPAMALMGAKSIPVLGGLVPAINPVVAVLGALVLGSEEGRDALSSIGESLGPLTASLGNFASEGLAAVADGIAVIAPVITGIVVPALDLLAGAFGATGEQAGIAGIAVGAGLGFMVGGPWGAAIGAGIGLLGEFAGALGMSGDAAGRTAEEVAAAEAAIRGLTAAMLEQDSVGKVATLDAITKGFTDLGEGGLDAIATLDGLGVSLQKVQSVILAGPGAVEEYRGTIEALALANGSSAEEATALADTFGAVAGSMARAGNEAAILASAQNDVAFFSGRFTESAFFLNAELGKLEGTLAGPTAVTPVLSAQFQNLAINAGAVARETFDMRGSMEEATAAGAPLVESLVASATQMFGNEQQAMNYTASLFGIPPERFTGVTNTADFASRLVEILLQKYGAIPRDPITTPVDADTSPATTALDSWIGWANTRTSSSTHTVHINEVGNLLTAHGGVFVGKQTRIIGEAGPEAVVPLGLGATATRDRERVMQRAGLAGPGLDEAAMPVALRVPLGGGPTSNVADLAGARMERAVASFAHSSNANARRLERLLTAMLAALADFADADEQTPFASRAA